MSFQTYQLDPKLLEALRQEQIEDPSPIQASVYEIIREGRDVLGVAKTGTGKTLAYLLPAVQNHICLGEVKDILILEPTRELVHQVLTVAEHYLGALPFKMVKICGGEELLLSEDEVSRVIVATPGRLLKALEQKEIDLSRVQTVIVDEADQFLRDGFVEVLQELLSHLDSEHQSLMFSATMTPSLEKFSLQCMIHPKVVNLTTRDHTVAKVEHHFQLILANRKLDNLVEKVKQYPDDQFLIFCNSKFIAERVYFQLQHSVENLGWLHGDLEQVERTRMFESFAKKEIRLLVSTDIAARGLDVIDLAFVFNYDFPMSRESFVHRSGRTGRMGRAGIIYTFLELDQMDLCKSILEQLKLEPIWNGPKPDFEQIKYKKPKKVQINKKGPFRGFDKGR